MSTKEREVPACFMVKNLRIHRFRCFKQLEIEHLSRINVLVGKNGAGKTALLEAIFMAAGGGPAAAIRLRRWRGFGQMLALAATKQGFESLWEDLFYNQDSSSGAMIEMVGDQETARRLTLEYRGDEIASLPLDSTNGDSSAIAPMVFESTDGHGVVSTVRAIAGTDGISTQGGARSVQAAFFNSMTLVEAAAEAATQFSALRQKNQTKSMLDGLRAVFPSIENLSVEIVAGGPVICGNAPPFPFPQPLGFASAGITKLVNILLGIASMPRGIVLIDEIENGFYYETLPQVWRAICVAARENKTQVFASTHSSECLRALSPLLAENSRDFSLLRISKEISGIQPIVELISGESLAAAITEEFEIR
jgi:hypothetical protein